MGADRVADWISGGQALRRMVDGVPRLAAEVRPLLDTLGRVLAEDVISPVDLPPWDNSAMDGFAARADDVRGASGASPVTLRVVDDVPAGHFAARAVGPGEAIRIMTGAPVPLGADGVIRVEHTDGGTAIGTAEGRVVIRSDADAGRNVRPRGEDVRAGSTVLRAGDVLTPGALAVAAGAGRDSLSVIRRPRVAILASGDELVTMAEYDQVLAGRRIVSTNSYALAAQLAEAGMEAVVLGIARDTRASLREHLAAAAGCDALITTAGISVGEHDHVVAALEELRTDLAFWRVLIRPGSAMAFGRVEGLGGIPWFGLPGNPVSTMATFALFVRPALLRMAGHARVHLPSVEATFDATYAARGELMNFPRVRLQRAAQDAFTATLTGGQGSGMASSMAAADGLAIVDAGRDVRPGDAVRVVLLSGAPLTENAPF
ncbi:gephyrin-like molybdotransferase Glp [Longimicrobium terrae]|uniref:Molybdopterin molybdenumtransferase n=1 Tax=Longimicrobium terrae TaxID=1639882 RepID=A0A841GNI7_9BACT|nr:gephyrin-like molybdotransferase Glp [Longimicrobium terrae]MBB4634660.1 molybdopterin molybdotransferase [Longimicrobium terrae]MBB6068450.1 molybdopterin molybdotransferase [Longimicrobium terrae]NNC32731.1 molybdopterin molybdotransferase MoeA [Longimicrobium terrae]